MAVEPQAPRRAEYDPAADAKACTVVGCNAPLKENVNRFAKRS